MIRGTTNESISSLSKQTHVGGAHTGTGTKGQSYELTEVIASGVKGESRDEFDLHVTTVSNFPSNSFNGSFE